MIEVVDTSIAVATVLTLRVYCCFAKVAHSGGNCKVELSSGLKLPVGD